MKKPAKSAKPAPEYWVLILDNNHGLDASLHATKELAELALQAYVAEWWDSEMNDPMPDDPKEAVEQYFGGEGAQNERAEITPCALNT